MTWLERFFYLGRPFAPVYGQAMRLRAWSYQRGILSSSRLPVPVLSVGNLTLGGSGKTPMVIYLARLLARSCRPVVVSRGYGGRAARPVNVVSDGREIRLSAEAAGDEPRLMAEALPTIPVLTGVKRAEVGRYGIECLAAEAIILDDGFQHLALGRDLDLVLFNSRAPLGNGRVFPGGHLREPLSALNRAHAFVLTGVTEDVRPEAIEFKNYLHRHFPGRPVFFSCPRFENVQAGPGVEPLTLEQARSRSWYAFCGLASPDSFRCTLEREHLKLVGFAAFPDHHRYTVSDLALLAERASGQGAAGLLTTSKDLVKITVPTRLPVYGLTIALELEEGFDRFVLAKIKP